MMLSIARLLLVALLVGAPWPRTAIAEPSASCLAYEPTPVQLTGILRRHTFPGPPNYEDVKRGDAAETGYYLHLGASVCTLGTDEAAAKAGVTLVQLALDVPGYRALRRHLGKRVTFTGVLSPAVTGHHHAPLLLTSPSIKVEK